MKKTLIILAASTSIAFAGGWKVNGWRLESKFQEAQIAVIDEYNKIQEQRRKEWEEKIKIDTQERLILTTELEKTRNLAETLRTRIDTSELINSEVLTMEKLNDCPTYEQIKSVVVNHNPFTRDFVRLWNSAARGAGPGNTPTSPPN